MARRVLVVWRASGNMNCGGEDCLLMEMLLLIKTNVSMA